MFFENPHADLIFRTLILAPIAVAWIIFVVRLVGLRSFSKMTAFDFITTLATGSLLASAATSTSWPSYFQALGAVLILLSTQAAIAAYRFRNDDFRKGIENKPVLLMEDGIMLEENIRKMRVDESDIFGKLREANVMELSRVRAVVLEATGDISVLHGEKLDADILEGVTRTT